MKARFLALAALVLGLASCQTEPEGLNGNVGGEQDVTVCVSLPEATRANDSAEGAFVNVVESDEYTIRYILQVYYGTVATPKQFEYSDDTSVTFDVRLVPGRDYKFVVWADVVKEATKEDDWHYNTADLTNITFNGDWNAMDETRDAFTCVEPVNNYSGTSEININLTRPFAKLRVQTTDMAEIRNLGLEADLAVVQYTSTHYSSFNALTGEPFGEIKEKRHEFDIEGYEDGTLFVDYFYAKKEAETVKFVMAVYDANETEPLKTNNFTTDIPVQRNYLTTIKGNVLTDGNIVNVEVVENGAFAGAENWPDPNSDAEKLAYAAMFGGEVTLTENVELTQPLEIVEGANVVINLEGKTLTGAIELAEGAELTVNNGVIKNTDRTVSGITSNGDLTLNNVTIESARHGVRVESGNVVINGGEYKVAPISASTLHALNVGDDGTTANVVIKGGTFIGPKGTMADSGSAVNVRNGSSVVIEGGNFSGGKSKTLSGVNITVKGGTFDQNPVNYVADGYKVIEKDGKFVVVSNEVDTVVASKEDVQNALKDAATAGETEVVIDANGANINLYYGLSKTTVPAGTTVTIRNANVEGSCYGNSANGTVIFEGCTFNNSGAYSIHFDDGNGNVIFKNCDLYGWNSFGASLTSVEFENCSLTGNGTYALIRSYANLTLTNCVINTSNANHNDNYSEGVEAIAPATLTENNVTYVAENPEALKAAINNGGNIVLAADIEMSESINNYNNVNFTLDGNGHTITMAEGATNAIALFDIEGGKATIKNVVFDGIKNGAVVRTVDTDFEVDNVTAQNCTHNVGEGLFRLRGKNTIKNSTFKSNISSKGLILTLNFDGEDPELPQVVENCVFESNTANSSAIVYYVKGSSCTINGNKFVGNIVNCDTNGATLYMGFQENCVITNNLFQNNTVNESNTSSRVAGGVFFGYEAVFTGNAFIDNRVTGTNAKGNDVCVSTYYTSISLSGNYWGGNAPVEDNNYFVQHKSDERTVIINDYLTANPFN